MLNVKKIGLRVSWITILLNLFLSSLKLCAGIIGNSMAMISDSIHSASDVLSTFVVIIGLKLSSKGADQDHPFGHERMESLSALFLALLLFSTGCFIGWQGIQKLLFPNFSVLPNMIALIAAIISIISKEVMFWYTRNVAIKIDSHALMADAWHHRSDALSSIGSLIGIIGGLFGLWWSDSFASLVICLVILKVSFDIAKESAQELLDTSCDSYTEFQLRCLILGTPQVYSLDCLRTRLFGNRIFVEIEIGVSKDMSLEEAHGIAHIIHDQIEKNFEKVKHCMVHVNPST